MAGSKMPRAEWSIVSKAPFVVPPLKEQEAIVKIVLLATAEHAMEVSYKELMLQQKFALMQQLLTGKRRVKLESAV